MIFNPAEEENKLDPMTKQASTVNLRSYLEDLYKQKNLGDDQRMKLEQSVAESKPGGGLTFLASLGAGLAGKNQSDVVNSLNQGSRDKQKELEAFDAKRAGVFDELKKDREIGKFERDNKDDLESDDPESEKSRMMQTVAARLMPGRDFSKASARQLSTVMPQLKSVFDQELDSERRKEDLAYKQQELGVRRQDIQTQRQIKQDEKELAKAEKQKILEDELTTPYGRALTKTDAKDIKDAHVSKQNFDSKLNEMIALREKFGGEVFNREAVGRGKQLSKDLLLEYKNMAKLGVLSQADTDIINAIIPDDPLAFSMTPGQDPILYKMKKFKEDSDKDFQTRVATRVPDAKGVSVGGAQRVMSDQDKQALDWAKSNPDDPRSAEIIKRLGM
jgi:hypothetical protein